MRYVLLKSERYNYDKRHFVENKTSIIQHVLKM